MTSTPGTCVRFIETFAQVPGRAQGLSNKALMTQPFFSDWQITGFLVVGQLYVRHEN